MPRHLPLLGILLISCLAAVPGVAAADIQRLPISLEVDGITLSGTLFRPTQTGKRPAVLCLHGFADSSSEMLPVCENLAHLGYVALALDFRGCGRSTGRAEFARGEVQDALAALAYLRRQEFVDAQRIGVFGAGMGGMTALLAAAEDASLRAAVAFMAPTDCALFAQELRREHPPLAEQVEAAIGGSPAAKPEEYRRRSPLTVAARIAAPVLLVYGEKDASVPPAHGHRLREAMARAGRTCVVKSYPDEGNAFTSPANATDSALLLLRFFNEKLGNTPPAGSLEACLLRRMELLRALHRQRAAGTQPSAAALAACDLALAALEAGKYPEADSLLAEAVEALEH